MVKPRKASKRLTTAYRSKVVRKVKEHKRKIAKASKGTSHRKRKDPGIPKELPFRAQVLAEAEEAKARKHLKDKKKKSCLLALQEESTKNTEKFYETVQKQTNPKIVKAKEEDSLELVRSEVWEFSSPDDLQSFYGLPGVNSPETVEEFVRSVSFSIGRLLKGGIPDIKSTSKKILSDARTGKLPFLKKVKTPMNISLDEQINPIVVSHFSPAFKFSDTSKMSSD